MILTSIFIICKALGASWSWWWLVATVICDNATVNRIIYHIKDRKR